MKKRKPILCLDFDGVLHSYTSGWKGARNIPDRPVPGAMVFLAGVVDDFHVAIYSSRSRYFLGRYAMRRWVVRWLRKAGYQGIPLKRILKQISWPETKPPAFVTLDDRAVQFTGNWPTVSFLKSFRPWRAPK